MRELKIKLLFISFFFIFYLFRLYSVRPLKIPDQAEIKVIGRVSRQPYLKASNQIITVGPFLIKTNRFPLYFYGQKLAIVGKVTKRVINAFKTEFVFYYPAIRLVEENQTLINQTNLVSFLFRFENRLERLLSELLPEPQSSLLAGILLGSKKEMPQEFFYRLRETGTLHVVVASGYNITVIASFLINSLVKWVKRKKALILAFLGIFLYTLMAGAEPPVVRAAIMGSLTYLAQLLGREKDAFVSLIFAAALMLLISPLILFDIGFQLSFAATAGILLLSSRLKGKIFEIPWLGEDLRVTLAAQLATWPLIFFHFRRLSLISPLVNALVLPTIPIIMALGAMMVGLGFWFKPLAQLVAWLAWVPLTYFVAVIKFFGGLPWASYEF